ncbi:unnamed protein product [Zymoseptoria tritici ST99CH_1A5]|uniref:F-box domain-containing protein n=3 Tax=Zymoseptoria tritici TaxID=1047171 RepID=A0A1X7RWG4_ZYMT9|nr:unnamed protein product [Zymoseptoria tritici ST99CH_3D7]SMR53984.1 unnamed protein product [Zymoseptoria tritici ST99CH_1E4]SMR56178.1 unnamed protein product [Zymoseptoria tritici ST99CH_3D1]SMY25360.1 unnamed protein product [Zymoseptoria tritici ST99CH_1A5]
MTTANLLARLPGELRNSIWRDLVLFPDPIPVEPLCRPTHPKLHQPAISFTCAWIRAEVLSIFYSENTFHLGKIGYHSRDHIRLHDFNKRLDAWRASLGESVRDLRSLTMHIDGRCYAWDGVQPGDVKYAMKVVTGPKSVRSRSASPVEGGSSPIRKSVSGGDENLSLEFTMNDGPRCTCRIKPGVEEKAIHDGSELLEVMKEYSASYCEAVLEGECPHCGCSRLETVRPTEVRHLERWEDIQWS